MTEYAGPVCRGSWALGTACGHCERCLETKPVIEASKISIVPDARDELRGSIEEMKRNLPILMEASTQIAQARKAMFDAYRAAGFTEEQSLKLCINGQII